MNVQSLLLVLLGSGIGGVFRFLIAHFHEQIQGDHAKHFMPIFIANIFGSLLIGIVFAFLNKGHISEKYSLFLMTGFLGGFTTYSSFSLDIFRLVQDGALMTALFYIFSTLIFGILAVFAGYYFVNSMI